MSEIIKTIDTREKRKKKQRQKRTRGDRSYSERVVSQMKNANLPKKFLVSYNVTSLFTNIAFQETIDIAINFIFNHNHNLKSLKKNFKNFSFLLHHRLILFLMVSFITKLMD